MINISPDSSNISSAMQKIIEANKAVTGENSTATGSSNFAETVKSVAENISKVDNQQHTANQSIVELMSGKTQDVTSVVADMAKADVSFKVLVGVRNKLIEAYKQTMNMQI